MNIVWSQLIFTYFILLHILKPFLIANMDLVGYKPIDGNMGQNN